MPTEIGTYKVSDWVNSDIPGYKSLFEICHSFSANFIYQRSQSQLDVKDNSYQIYKTNDYGKNLIEMLASEDYSLLMPGLRIEPYDILLIPQCPRPKNFFPLAHSMIAITEKKWIGANNSNTFGLLFFEAFGYYIHNNQRTIVDLDNYTLISKGLKFDTQTHKLTNHIEKSGKIIQNDIYVFRRY